MSEKKEALRIDFSEEESKQFAEVQARLNIKNKTDVIRFCLKFTLDNYPNSRTEQARILFPPKNKAEGA